MRIEERHIATYNKLFVHRDDIYARQQTTGAYYLNRSPVTPAVIAAHLEGRITAGFYALDIGSTAKWAVLDADGPEGLEQLQQAWQQLSAHQLPSYLERSRRGGHLWTFLESPIPGAGARALIQAAVPNLQDLELYPKQGQLDSHRRVGSLVRGPLGTHLLSSARYPFADPISLRPVSSTIGGTIDYLKEAERVSIKQAAALVSAASHQSKQDATSTPREAVGASPARAESLSPIQRAKAQIGDPYAFLSRFIELDASGKAHCPFHPPDYHPSFALNRATGRWTDFHEFDPVKRRYVSGDMLDFYARINGLSSNEALQKILAEQS